MIYQIFPERFAIGAPNDARSKLAQPAYQRPGYLRHLTWDEAPQGEHDFFGGDLQGIVDHLDYVQDLGATAVYLTPVFTAHTNHKYNTADFSAIDPMFGDEHTLQALIDALHQRGMRLIMDAVFNHVGKDSDWFTRALRKERPFRDFFTFLPGGDYECWWGFDTLAELRLNNPLVQKLLWRAQDSVLQRWLGRGLDDWRFDTALDLGLEVAADIRRTITQRYPRARLIGEVMSFGADFCVGDRHFHGVMNYWFRSAVLGWFAGTVSTRALKVAIGDYYTRYGHDAALRSWNVLSTHDTPRLRSLLPDDTDRELALVLQFTLPGEPVVYYGEENGMQGAADPDNRRPMVWDEQSWDKGTRSIYRQLVAIRASRPELQAGRLIMLADYLDDATDAVAYIRHTDVPNQEALVVVNRGAHPLRQRVLLPHSHFYPTLGLKNLLPKGGSSDQIQCEQASVVLDLPPRTAAIYVPDDKQPNYSFFKSRVLDDHWP